jgi:3-oxoadipate enol-lactonase
VRIVPRDGYALVAECHGKGPPHVFCLHGLADTRAIWTRVFPSFVASGAFVRVDQRGHGDSSSPDPPYRLEDLAADAVAVLDSCSIDRAVFVGHSMGGVVALTAALAFPERVAGLVLLGTTSQVNARAAAWYESIAAAGEKQGIDGVRAAIFGPESEREIVADAVAIAGIVRVLAGLHRQPLTPRLGEVTCPAAVLVGERDPMGLAASEIVADGIPGARLTVVPGRGHWLQLEAPEAVVSAADDVLRR